MTMKPQQEPGAVMECDSIKPSFSAYLDGAVSGHEMQRIAAHLESCSPCAGEFSAWRTMQEALALLRPAKAPVDLSLRLRLAISREQAKRSTRLLDTLSLHWDNALRPWLVQVSAGFATAVVLLAALGYLFSTVAVPGPVLANDEPLGAITAAHYLYSAERPRPISTAHDATIVVEAQLNDQGRVFDYAIVSGPQDSVVRRQIENQLLLSVFEPASVFGAPVRSRVVLTYAGVSVRA